MKNVMFLPFSAVEGFLQQETVMDKLRYAVKTMAEAHKSDYKLESLDYELEDAEWAEPYAAIYGYSVPLLADVQMCIEYLNELEDAFYMDDDPSWGTICVCYVPKEQRVN